MRGPAVTDTIDGLRNKALNLTAGEEIPCQG
jgi:hypothetical protein